MRFTLLDRVLSIEPGKSITAIKTLSLAEEYLADHFPRFPVMPGVLMLESMTQAAAWTIRLGEHGGAPRCQKREIRCLRRARPSSHRHGPDPLPGRENDHNKGQRHRRRSDEPHRQTCSRALQHGGPRAPWGRSRHPGAVGNAKALGAPLPSACRCPAEVCPLHVAGSHSCRCLRQRGRVRPLAVSAPPRRPFRRGPKSDFSSGNSDRFFRLAPFGRRKMGNFGFPCGLADITTQRRPPGRVPSLVCKVKRRCRLAMKSLTR